MQSCAFIPRTKWTTSDLLERSKVLKAAVVSTSVELGLVPLIPLAPVLVFDLYVEGAAADVLVFTMRNVIMAATWAPTTRMLLAA